MLQIEHSLSMATTGYTPWVPVGRLAALSIGTYCGDVNDPVGVLTYEGSNDFSVIEAELRAGISSANSAAKAVTLTVSVSGSAWSNGYDGVGAKNSVVFANPATAYARVKYTRTSGGAADTLTVLWCGRQAYG